MPAEISRESRDPSGVKVSPSATVEFGFALFAFLNGESQFHGRAPWLERVAQRCTGIRERLDTFAGQYGKGDSGTACDDWGDVILLIARAGMLTGATPDDFFDWLESPAADFSPALPMESETEATNRVIAARVARLKSEPALRKAYVALLREFWAALRPEWEEAGAARAAANAETIRGDLARAEDWRRVIKGSLPRKIQFSQYIERAIREGELLIVPLALAPEGQLIYTFPGTLLVAFGQDAEKKTVRRRENAERASAVFKIFSDPTRNAILGALLNSEYSVTDLAAVFELSQPTVSAHVKLLRDASLLDAEKSGNQTVYRANKETVRRVLGGGIEHLLDSGI